MCHAESVDNFWPTARIANLCNYLANVSDTTIQFQMRVLQNDQIFVQFSIDKNLPNFLVHL